MECLICKQKKDTNFECYYCCVKFACDNCYDKIFLNKKSCPFCRQEIEKSCDYFKVYKLINYIESNKEETDSYAYVMLFDILTNDNLNNCKLALQYALKSTNFLINFKLGHYYAHTIEDMNKAIGYYLKGANKDQFCIRNLLNYYFEYEPNLKIIENLFKKYKLTETNKNEYYFFQATIAFLKKDYQVAKHFYLASEETWDIKYINLHIIYKKEEDYVNAENIILQSEDEALIEHYSLTKRLGGLIEKKDNKRLKMISEIFDEN